MCYVKKQSELEPDYRMIWLLIVICSKKVDVEKYIGNAGVMANCLMKVHYP